MKATNLGGSCQRNGLSSHCFGRFKIMPVGGINVESGQGNFSAHFLRRWEALERQMGKGFIFRGLLLLAVLPGSRNYCL
jgi:hypothetical protein